MSLSLIEVEQQARKLSADERAQLAETLLESLQNGYVADIEAAWQLEIEQRVAAYEQGNAEIFSAGDVFAEAKRIAR